METKQTALPAVDVDRVRKESEDLDSRFRHALDQLEDIHRRQDAILGRRPGA